MRFFGLRQKLLALIISVSVVALAGCQRSFPFRTVRVEGRVTYNDKPVPTGTVMFVPKGNGPPATGEIAPDGTYKMTTYVEFDGAVIDTHQVSITALSFRQDALPEEQALPPPIVPDKYLSHLTSELTADVREQEINVIDFKLVD